jgi:hypothetical protein
MSAGLESVHKPIVLSTAWMSYPLCCSLFKATSEELANGALAARHHRWDLRPRLFDVH